MIQQFHFQVEVSMEEWIKFIYIYFFFSHEKGGYPVFCNNTDDIWAHYGKQDKSDWERQEPYDIMYTWNLKRWNPWKNGVKWW